jgi:hypothetical protein
MKKTKIYVCMLQIYMKIKVEGHTERCVSTTKISQLMSHREASAVYCENYTKYLLRVKDAVF